MNPDQLPPPLSPRGQVNPEQTQQYDASFPVPVERLQHWWRRRSVLIAGLAVLLVSGGAAAAWVTLQPGKAGGPAAVVPSSSPDQESEPAGTTPTPTTRVSPSPAPSSSPTPGASPAATPKPSSGGSSSTPTPAPTPKSYTVTFDGNGFSPASITIRKGEIIRFYNASSNKDMWPASDDHPTHQIYSAFNAGRDYGPGSSYSFTFTQKGTWGYHDHNKPSVAGTVTVQ